MGGRGQIVEGRNVLGLFDHSAESGDGGGLLLGHRQLVGLATFARTESRPFGIGATIVKPHVLGPATRAAQDGRNRPRRPDRINELPSDAWSRDTNACHLGSRSAGHSGFGRSAMMRSFWTVSESADQDSSLHSDCDTLAACFQIRFCRKAVSLKIGHIQPRLGDISARQGEKNNGFSSFRQLARALLKYLRRRFGFNNKNILARPFAIGGLS